jgi:glutathione synthase/RimK-type ligase-like ATP-grasp enzyme
MKYFNIVKEHLKGEFKSFIKFFYSIENSIDNPNRYEVNKLDTLLKARNIGLQIPQTLVTKNKCDIFKYLGNKKPIICKPVTDLLQIKKNGLNRSHLIKLLNASAINDLPELFGISLFQEYIIKKYEIRVFCIYNEIFAVANFSNLNNLSKIDGRNLLNNENMVNRIVPYLLSLEIKNKIIALMKELHIDSGSFDFIYGVDKNLYFLEVNPVGQFGGVSYFGNYHIEKSIAKILCTDESN